MYYVMLAVSLYSQSHYFITHCLFNATMPTKNSTTEPLLCRSHNLSYNQYRLIVSNIVIPVSLYSYLLSLVLTFDSKFFGTGTIILFCVCIVPRSMESWSGTGAPECYGNINNNPLSFSTGGTVHFDSPNFL